jgi:Flp pilus assembly protein TadD
MAVDRDDAELVHGLAFFYWWRNQTERAAALAYAAFRLGKTDARLGCLLALTLVELGRPEQSLEILRLTENGEEEATQASRCTVRARALLHLGRIGEARAVFEQGLALQDDDEPPLLARN